MIGRHSRGLLGVVAMLAAFGLSPPPQEPEIDLAEVAKVLDLLAAAGIASPDVLEAAGSPARFIVTARKVLAAQAFLASFGEPGITDVGRLLAPSKAIERDDQIEAAALSRVIDDLPAFHGRPLARRLPDGSVTSTRPTIDEARRDPDAFARYVMSDHHPTMTRRERGPVDFKRAGEESRARRVVIASTSGQAGYLEVGPDGWRSSAPVIKRSKRPAKSRDERDEQAADRKARARRKARRGW
jgi:hypothetical protein